MALLLPPYETPLFSKSSCYVETDHLGGYTLNESTYTEAGFEVMRLASLEDQKSAFYSDSRLQHVVKRLTWVLKKFPDHAQRARMKEMIVVLTLLRLLPVQSPPSLPLDIAEIIFLLAARTNHSTAVTLAFVSKTVQRW